MLNLNFASPVRLMGSIAAAGRLRQVAIAAPDPSRRKFRRLVVSFGIMSFSGGKKVRLANGRLQLTSDQKQPVLFQKPKAWLLNFICLIFASEKVVRKKYRPGKQDE